MSSQNRLLGSPPGTPGYRSPEQADGRYDRLQPTSDVYSLGATLYYLLTGRSPVESNKPGETAHLVEPVGSTSPRSLDPTIPKPLEAICLMAMASKPEARYSSARELADDVERFMAGEPVTAWPEPFGVRAQRSARRHRTIVASALVALAAGVIGLVVLLVVQAQHTTVLAAKNVDLRIAQERAERAAETARSRARIGVVANNAIVSTVREDKDLAEPAFKALRDRLLRLIFRNLEQWKNDLDQHRNDDPDTLSDLAAAHTSFATISGEISSKQDALNANKQARSLVEEVVEQSLSRGQPATLQPV